MFGAVFHDALFYGVTNPARPLENMAHALHGADGQDTFNIVRFQAGHASSSPDKHLSIALLVGMVSHIFADVTMHPMIWHLSGNYYASDRHEKSLARQRHRALESLMDMAIYPEMIGRPLFTAHRLLRSMGNTLYSALPINSLAKMAGISPETARIGLRSANRTYATFQRAYAITPLAFGVFKLIPILPDPLREIAALFYAPQLLKQKAAVTGTINYLHPVTGEAISATIPDMIEEAAERAANLCLTLEDAVHGSGDLQLTITGPSMDAGLSKVPTAAMRHYATPAFPKLP